MKQPISHGCHEQARFYYSGDSKANTPKCVALEVLQRWSPGYDHYPDKLDVAGAWVRYEDASALLQQLAAAERAKDEACGHLRMIRNSYGRLWAKTHWASPVDAFLSANGGSNG